MIYRYQNPPPPAVAYRRELAAKRQNLAAAVWKAEWAEKMINRSLNFRRDALKQLTT